MTTPLPDDIARCHDHECPERERCRRWLERRVDASWINLMLGKELLSQHSWSLRENYDEPCKHQIEPEKEKP